jgi:hypothetical protein
MHDARGRILKAGDKVLIVGTIKELFATEDYCNCSVRTAFGRRPDGQLENISAINTGVLLRNNDGDVNLLDPYEEPLTILGAG